MLIINSIEKAILHLSLISGVGPKTIQIITKNYTLTDDIYLYTLNYFQMIGFSYEKSLSILSGLANKNILDIVLEKMNKKNIVFFTPYNSLYPKELLQQEIYPAVLYQKGNGIQMNLNNYITLGIVSSRKTNDYGKRVIYELLQNLVGYDIAILSGGAIGGDTIIHEASIKYNIPTVAVLGSGLENLYPQQNLKLFSNIINNGGVLMSHFHIDQLATKNTFPIRNSIIAGMSRAVLVIQAGENSGTLITARYALEYNKNVGAIPGYIDDIVMKASNNLIKQGAFCILSYEDILDLLEINFKKKDIQIDFQDDILTVIEINIISFCIEPKTILEISNEFKINIDILYLQLFQLLEKKYIKQDILGNWLKI